MVALAMPNHRADLPLLVRRRVFATAIPRLESSPQCNRPEANFRQSASLRSAVWLGDRPGNKTPAFIAFEQGSKIRSAVTTDYNGPDPYVDYDRRFTPEDGIAITYKTIDESGWRTALRILMLLAVTVLAIVYLAKGSPYPMLPRGCPVFGGCPIPMRWDRYMVDAVLLVAFSGLAAWILFAEVQVYREVEIRADCMILDGDGIFWAEKFELGWPQFVPGKDGMQVLTGVYGTRHTEFLKVKAFDELDRGPAVFAAHLMAAMQQQWSQGA